MKEEGTGWSCALTSFRSLSLSFPKTSLHLVYHILSSHSTLRKSAIEQTLTSKRPSHSFKHPPTTPYLTPYRQSPTMRTSALLPLLFFLASSPASAEHSNSDALRRRHHSQAERMMDNIKRQEVGSVSTLAGKRIVNKRGQTCRVRPGSAAALAADAVVASSSAAAAASAVAASSSSAAAATSPTAAAQGGNNNGGGQAVSPGFDSGWGFKADCLGRFSRC